MTSRLNPEALVLAMVGFRCVVRCLLVVLIGSLVSRSALANEVFWLDVQQPPVNGSGTELRLGTNRFVFDLLPQVAAITTKGFERSGLKLALMDLPPERSLLYAAQGMLDGDLFRGHFDTSEHPSLLKVNVPLTTLYFYPYVRQEHACMAHPEQLKEKSSIGIHGLHYFKLLKEKGIHHANEAPNTISGVKMLAAGRADFIVLPDYVVSALEKVTDVRMKRCLEAPILSIQLFTYLHEKHRALIPALEQAYREILTEGQL